MANIKKILVPLDLGETSDLVLDQAAALATKVEATIDLLYGFEVPDAVPVGLRTSETTFGLQSLTALVEEEARRRLNEFATRASARGVVIAHTFAELGTPARTIVETARTGHHDLIVMGTHGRTGLSHMVLGSVAEKVVRHAHCPVLTLRGTNPHVTLPTRLLVPVDYSASSAASLTYAVAFAELLRAKLDVVHVWDRPRFVSDDTLVHGPGDTRRSLGELIREGAEREMREFLSTSTQERGDIPADVSSRLLSGDPATALLGELALGQHDLVVTGTRGRTGLQHLLLGSVAEKLVRLSPVPVLTVPLRHA